MEEKLKEIDKTADDIIKKAIEVLGEEQTENICDNIGLDTKDILVKTTPEIDDREQ